MALLGLEGALKHYYYYLWLSSLLVLGLPCPLASQPSHLRVFECACATCMPCFSAVVNLSHFTGAWLGPGVCLLVDCTELCRPCDHVVGFSLFGVNALQERSQATETTPQSSDKRMVQPGSHHPVKAQSDTPTTWSHGRHITVQSAKRQTPGPNHAPAT
jgi:hypothetical protein